MTLTHSSGRSARLFELQYKGAGTHSHAPTDSGGRFGTERSVFKPYAQEVLDSSSAFRALRIPALPFVELDRYSGRNDFFDKHPLGTLLVPDGKSVQLDSLTAPPRQLRVRKEAHVVAADKVDFASQLPAHNYIGQVLKAACEHQPVVIVGATGCGKSFTFPHALAVEGFNVRTASQRRDVAEMGARFRSSYDHEELGEFTAYMHSMGGCRSERTKDLRCTIGRLLEYRYEDIRKGRIYEATDIDIVDDGHDASIERDILFAVHKYQEAQGSAPLLWVMSASIDASPIRQYLGGAELIEVQGQRFSVEEVSPRPSPLQDVQDAFGRERTVLVFTAGKKWIYELAADVSCAVPEAEVLTYHAQLPTRLRLLPFEPPAEGIKRVTIASNAGENGLTMPVNTVIIDGKTRRMVLDEHDVSTLIVCDDSQHGVIQKIGRVGRKESGESIYRGTQFDKLVVSHPAEIKSVHLDSHYLRMVNARLPAAYILQNYGINRPHEWQLRTTERRLQYLGLLEPGVKEDWSQCSETSEIAEAREFVSSMRIHPTSGRMLLEARKLDYGEGKFTDLMIDIVSVIETEGIVSYAKAELLSYFRREKYPNSDPLRQAFLMAQSDLWDHGACYRFGLNEAKLESALELRSCLRKRNNLVGESFRREQFSEQDYNALLKCIWKGSIYNLFLEAGYAVGDNRKRAHEHRGLYYLPIRAREDSKIKDDRARDCQIDGVRKDRVHSRKMAYEALIDPGTKSRFFVGTPLNIGDLTADGEQRLHRLLLMPTEIPKSCLATRGRIFNETFFKDFGPSLAKALRYMRNHEEREAKIWKARSKVRPRYFR